MAHHPQLTAHSQLTNLVPGQIQRFQLPPTATLLSSTANQPIPPIVHPTLHTFLRNTPLSRIQDVGCRGECIICYNGTLSSRISRQSFLKPSELFVKTCQLLEVPFHEIQHEWDLESGVSETLPFCILCADALHELIGMKEQLEVLRNRLMEGIRMIKATICQSDSRVSARDFRTANFRARVLLNGQSGLNRSNTHIRPFSYEPEISCELNSCPDSTESHLQLNETEAVRLDHNPDSPRADQLYDGSTETEDSFVPIQSLSPQEEASIPTNINGSFEIQSGMDCDYEVEVVNAFSSLNNDEQEVLINPYENAPEFFWRKDDEMELCGNRVDAETIPEKNKRKVRPKTLKAVRSSKTSSSSASHKKKVKEYFAPTTTDEHGTMLFEGIAISSGKQGYICGDCGIECGKGQDPVSLRKIKIHIKGVHLKAYKCETCNKNFNSRDILAQHTVRAHQLENVPCDVCGRPVKPKYLSNHKFTHMNVQEKEIFIAQTGFKPLITRSEPKHSCNACGKRFSKLSLLLRHQASHLGKDFRKSHKCDLCDRIYATNQALKEHQTLRHDRPGSIGKRMCKHCGVIMHSKLLRKHLMSHIAKEERPFVCKICKKRLLSLKSLNRHESDHQPEEVPQFYKFECDICGQRFFTLKSRNNHRKKSHQEQSKVAVSSKIPVKGNKLKRKNNIIFHGEERPRNKVFKENVKDNPRAFKTALQSGCQEESEKGGLLHENKLVGDHVRQVKLKRGYVIEYILPETNKAKEQSPTESEKYLETDGQDPVDTNRLRYDPKDNL